MSDRLHQLALFVHTVESGSFSKAAREFGLTQPSVSRAIAALERRLGVKLLVRTTRQVSATEAGEALLGAGPRRHARDRRGGGRGARRRSIVRRAASRFAAGLWRLAHRAAAAGLHDAAPALEDRSHDVGPLREPDRRGRRRRAQNWRPPDSTFVAKKLESARRLFIASPAYLTRRGTPKRLADLARHDLIGGPPDTSDETRVLEERTRRAPDGQSARPFAPATGVIACAIAGLGIATGSSWMCAGPLGSGQAIEILADYALEPITAYVVFPDGRRPSRRARAFADYLHQALAAIGDD